MSPYFYSLEMIITGRGWNDHPNLTAMDLLAVSIADEEKPLHPMLNFIDGRRALAEKGERND